MKQLPPLIEPLAANSREGKRFSSFAWQTTSIVEVVNYKRIKVEHAGERTRAERRALTKANSLDCWLAVCLVATFADAPAHADILWSSARHLALGEKDPCVAGPGRAPPRADFAGRLAASPPKSWRCAPATGRWSDPGEVVTLDADRQHRPDEMERLAKPVLEGKVDVAHGPRVLGHAERNHSLAR